MRVPAALATLLAIGVLVSAAAARQDSDPRESQDPTFRAGTRTVPVFVTVTDRIGRLVLDLRREEFQVLDDGRPRPLSLFTRDLQPITAVVLLDASRSMVNALDTVLTAADHLVVRLMAGDRAMVGSFSDEIRFASDFTDDRDLLARQVNDLFGLRIGLGTSLWDAIDQAVQALTPHEGRRMVVVFTDGDDTASLTPSVDVLARARGNDVMIYSVIMRGMARPPENRRGRRIRPQQLANISLATGGGYYFVGNVLDDMNSIATQIAMELHSQYVLGFVPPELDGKLHKLEVRVTRPGVKVRARDSYLAVPQPARASQQ